MSHTLTFNHSNQNITANLTLYNPIDNTNKIPAILDIGLEKPLLPKGKDYKLTVLRFICPLSSVQPPFSLKGKTFKVIIENNSTSGTANQTISDTVQSISDFVSIVNNLLLTAHQQLYDSSQPPYIYFQSENRLFYLIVPEFYLIGPDDLQIYFNESLYYYVSGFPSKDVIIGGQLFKQTIVYDIADDGFQYQPPVKTSNYGGRWTSPGYARKVASEYTTDYKFNWLISVLVTSNLPIRHEVLPMRTGPVFQNLNNPVSYISTLPILQDFRPDVN
jgi:hypothetical protein